MAEKARVGSIASGGCKDTDEWKPAVSPRAEPRVVLVTFSHAPRGGTAGVSGEQVEDKAFYDAASIAAMRIGCLPGNARNAVAMAAIAANTQADRKT